MIIVLNKFGINLNSRALAGNIFSELLEKDIIIDFKDVESATPSFCHEMLVILKQKNIKTKVINSNDDINLQMKKAFSSIEKSLVK